MYIGDVHEYILRIYRYESTKHANGTAANKLTYFLYAGQRPGGRPLFHSRSRCALSFGACCYTTALRSVRTIDSLRWTCMCDMCVYVLAVLLLLLAVLLCVVYMRMAHAVS